MNTDNDQNPYRNPPIIKNTQPNKYSVITAKQCREIRTPLLMLTILAALSFLYGAVVPEIPNDGGMGSGAAGLLGLGMIGAVIWMCIVGFRDTAMRTPLVIITAVFVICFFDGAFELELFNENAYGLLGWTVIGMIIWMWIIELRR